MLHVLLGTSRESEYLEDQVPGECSDSGGFRKILQYLEIDHGLHYAGYRSVASLLWQSRRDQCRFRDHELRSSSDRY